ncbi:probable 6-phosphogluconolactonase-like protein 1 [Saccharomycodes ludwigii]|uniref:Probable 6-phosphogluconolactonase-like protein 1 n=1 Tax=Saccharomycodes ludwigii TaxID=36035 RepID=A0A376B8Z1_9ASCO|nr:hypothetical protein SCDLUD_003744 [Saccharomycodes ludwigii]KAH3900739.1 hypothetical protein SCDLUD_003744 [Saccharomycodes ludwigii]SSD60590.1 probable 6-phosphogluconolactonase-like protein 1 [Saccharomycodes ludwigii]
MTTTVPKIFAFHEFDDVAEAVADHIVYCQNLALNKYNTSKTGTNDGVSNAPDSNEGNSNNTSNLKNNNQSNNASPNTSNTNIDNKPHKRKVSIHYSNKNTNDTEHANGKQKKDSANNTRFKIALSGGSLLEVLHNGLLKRNDIKWDKWDIYFADERLVPFSSPESNYGLAKRKIFDLIDVKAYGKPNVYHIDESLLEDPEACADQYEQTLIKQFASKDSVRLPMFDLFLLGCAPDGHIASLFPNFQGNLREKHAWCIPVVNAPHGPKNRISLTVPVICHSHQVTFVVEGAVKAPVVKTIMERPEKGLPSSIVNEGAAGRVSWFVDDDALNDVCVTKKKYKYMVQ